VPRKPPSPADRALIGYARGHGETVSATRLERWRAAGLLPPNVPRRLGRGRGSTSQPAEGAGDLVVWLARHARPGRRPYDLVLPPGETPPGDPGMVKVSVPEARRLLNIATSGLSQADKWLHLHWSSWRRRHQAHAHWYHYHQRLTAAAVT
jgi:hypothetical protein